ncbi:MAG: tRNA epoxyqueuosine(34) reductase QueG [Sedimentisphaerales bacterium]|nr:tRNA epoxyqueuosine(34) reductase QueG [Sedimentisphaerales bacterium]MBN2842505.1 tRNA epoxyqueuosine(34) reductase QueG [Sedimentisphaerales bacterium]
MFNSKQIKEKAIELGFVLVGISPAQTVNDTAASGLRDHLALGNNAQMQYLARNIDKRLDVRALVPGARSVISCAASYRTDPALTELADSSDLYIAQYARRKDYHIIIRNRLQELAQWLLGQSGGTVQYRCFVDTAPLMEKYYAVEAGLGWLGRNNLLINEEYGSWLLLGELVVDIELEYDSRVLGVGCGSCRRCLDACPGGALQESGQFDSRRCLSYHTIESKEEIPAELAAVLANRVFGCDQCQLVCPYNHKARSSNDQAFAVQFSTPGIAEIEAMTQVEFNSRYKDTPLERAGLERMKYIASLVQKA